MSAKFAFKFVVLAGNCLAPWFGSVDTVEVNECRNPDTGEVRFVQVIYDDYHDSSRLAIVDWHMADKCLAIVHTGKPEFPYTILRQLDSGAVQSIRARKVVGTVTNYDPEDLHRDVLRAEDRPGIK